MPKRFGTAPFQYDVDEGWPKQPVPGVAASVAVDSRGRAYIGVRNTPEGGGVANILPGVGHILVLGPDGRVADNWGNTFSSPHAVWINADDEVFVADTGLHTITKHAPTGELLLTLGTTGTPGAPGQPFNMPTGAVQAPNGDIVVSDGYGQNWMHRFTEQGEHILSWGGGDPVFIQKFRGEPVTGTVATDPGRFNLPHDVYVDANSRVYVMDRENRRWQVFALDGQLLSVVEDVNRPCDVAVDADGYFHVVGGGTVEVWTPDGRKLDAWGEQGEAPGQFKGGPHGVWIDAEGSLYVAEVGANNGLTRYRRV